MKRVANILLALALLCTVCACNKPAEDQTPESGLSWQEQYDLGLRYLSEGKYEEAILAFTAAIEIDPKQAPAYVGRGDAYVQLGDTEENLTAARLDYEKAIELDELLVEAYLGLADVYIRQGDTEGAKTLLERGLEATGDSRLQTKLDEQTAEEWPRVSETVLEDGSTLYWEGYEDGSSLQRQTLPDGSIVVMEYDTSNRMVRLEHHHPDSNGVSVRTVLYQYQEGSAEVAVSCTHVWANEMADDDEASFSHTMLSPDNAVEIVESSFGSLGGDFTVAEYALDDRTLELRRVRYDVDENGAVTGTEEVPVENGTIY